jgi:DNA polymerase-1
MKMYIFDVSNIFYRAFYANNLATSYGFPTGGLHGFLRMSLSIIRDARPELVAFAMEGEGPSPRKQIEPLYKANRTDVPPELKQQLAVLPELMHVMGFPTFKFQSFEADDIIASIVKLALKQGIEPVIVSSDKDFCQLVQGPVKMYNIGKEEMVDENGVFARYGIRPDQFIDYLSIVGDTSDNIQGVKGVGPKGAEKLLQEYGTLDAIYQNVGLIKGATQKKLIESKDQVFRARELVKFMDVPFIADLRTVCNWAGPRRAECIDFLKKYEFREIESILFRTEVVTVGGVEIGVRR